ncbi:hypothetical protein [Pasteuria penetrans]|uniref:hypothetical protein n=1 Tax=Pasteuria penetrans TaxID=86005 RepID=UPI000F9D5A4D|nr:hypothetical protein [Pasteuria penetrans]
MTERSHPIVRGWADYYGAFGPSRLRKVLCSFNGDVPGGPNYDSPLPKMGTIAWLIVPPTLRSNGMGKSIVSPKGFAVIQPWVLKHRRKATGENHANGWLII